MEDDFISKFLELLSVAVFIGVFFVGYYFYLKFSKYRAETKLEIGRLQKQLDSTKKGEVSPQELTILKARLDVLEKIVTDPKFELDKEISNL